MKDEAQIALGYKRFCSGPFIWPINAPEKYIELYHRLNSYWWAEGCGQGIVKAAEMCLRPCWSSLLDWPKQAVGLA